MQYYRVLGISRDAGRDEIRKAFRGLVRRYHPDAGGNSPPEKFHDVVEAYEVLSDPIRRKQYDRTLPDVRSVQRPLVEPLIQAPARVEPLTRSRQVSLSSHQCPGDALRLEELIEEVLGIWERAIPKRPW